MKLDVISLTASKSRFASISADRVIDLENQAADIPAPWSSAGSATKGPGEDPKGQDPVRDQLTRRRRSIARRSPAASAHVRPGNRRSSRKSGVYKGADPAQPTPTTCRRRSQGGVGGCLAHALQREGEAARA